MFLVLFNLGVVALIVVSAPNRKDPYRLFGWAIALLTLCRITGLSADFVHTSFLQRLLLNVDFVFGLLAAQMYLEFTIKILFAKEKRVHILRIVFRSVTLLLITILLLTDLIIKDVEYTTAGVSFVSGYLDYFFVAFIVLETIIAALLLMKAYRSTTIVDTKNNLRFVLLGSYAIVSFMILMLISERLLVTSRVITPLTSRRLVAYIGEAGIIAFVGITGYGILRHRLFGIRIWLGRTVFWLGIALSGLLLSYLIAVAESKILGSVFDLPVIIINLFFAIFVALFLAFTEKHWRKLINIWLGRMSFDEDELLNVFKSELSALQSPEDKPTLFLNYIDKLFNPSKIAILSFGKEEGMLTLYKNFSDTDKKILEDEENLNKLINDIGVGAFDIKNANQDSSLLLLIKALGVNLVVMALDKELIVLLGIPKAGEYNHKGSKLLVGLLNEMSTQNF